VYRYAEFCGGTKSKLCWYAESVYNENRMLISGSQVVLFYCILTKWQSQYSGRGRLNLNPTRKDVHLLI